MNFTMIPFEINVLDQMGRNPQNAHLYRLGVLHVQYERMLQMIREFWARQEFDLDPTVDLGHGSK